MQESRSILIRQLDNILHRPIHKVWLGSANDPPPHAKFTDLPRLLVPLAGVHHVRSRPDGIVTDLRMKPGQVLALLPRGWTVEHWDYSCLGLSCVFRQEFVRVITYRYRRLSLPPGAPEVWYHTHQPPNKLVRALLDTLSALEFNAHQPDTRVAILRALLAAVRDMLATDKPLTCGKARHTWLIVRQYLEDHCQEPINREDVARVFQMHPNYFSRLCRQQEENGFIELLLRLRMERASRLLRQGRPTVDEVASGCGFRSTSYFIHIFRRHYGISPGAYHSTKDR